MRLSTQTGEVIFARTLSESYPVWLKKRTLRMLKKAASLRQGYGRHASGIPCLRVYALYPLQRASAEAGRHFAVLTDSMYAQHINMAAAFPSINSGQGWTNPSLPRGHAFLTIPSKSD